MKQRKRSLTWFLVAVSTLVIIVVAMGSAQSGKMNYKFDKDGNLTRPEGYRQWVYIGTPITPNSENGGEAAFPDFHNVYIHPGDFEHYRKHGDFRDGTILVKELVSVGSTLAVSGMGHFMGEFIGLEATIKDSKRYSNEPGNWAYFSFGHSYPLAEKAQAFPTAACNSCHESSAAQDFVFTQYYPVLRAVRGTGEMGMHQKGGEDIHIGGACEVCLDGLSKFPRTGSLQPPPKMDMKPGMVPASKDALFAFLQSGEYKSWAHESEVHKSRGPHFDVQTYINPALENSLMAQNKSHPKGAASIKEMYKEGSPTGWAVSVKTQANSDNGKGWYWYEVLSTTDGDKVVAEGNGVGLCVGCHFPGKDFIVTGYPLK